MDSITLLESLLTILVVSAQLKAFHKTRARASELAGLFPASEPPAYISHSNQGSGEEKPASISLQAPGGASPVFDKIISDTNRYLRSNPGSPPDATLLQGIADRKSDTIQTILLSTATFPLYLGLMGTFIGVIVGLITIAWEPSSAISDSDLKRFVGGVLVAMIGSLCGLILTVIARAKYIHAAISQNDSCKQAYFTFLQAELVPVMGRDVSATLYNLQLNLHRFNDDFKSNVALFAEALSGTTSMLEQQRDVVSVLKSAKLSKIIETNTELMTKSETVVSAMAYFVDAVAQLEHKVQASGTVAAQLNALLNRFTTFETSINSLGDKLSVDNTVAMKTVQLIESQLDALKGRSQLITQYVDAQDEEVKKFIADQRQKLSDVANKASQQLNDLTADILESIPDIVTKTQAAQLLEDVALLKVIGNHIQQIDSRIDRWQQGDLNGKILELLGEIASSTKTNGSFGRRLREAIGHILKVN